MSCIDFFTNTKFSKSTEVTTNMTLTKNKLKISQWVQIFS